MTINTDILQLIIRGELADTDVERSRQIHNATAGHPEGVAAARALGDLSHNVYVPLDAGATAKELLILDLWTSIDGLRKFFSNPDVQAGGAKIFKTRDPVVWQAADVRGFILPTPTDKTERYVGLVRGTVTSRESAAAVLDELVAMAMNQARLLGQVSHQMFYRASAPGEPPSLELAGIDVWTSAEGAGTFYADPRLQKLYSIFAAPPVSSMWKQAPGAWVEW